MILDPDLSYSLSCLVFESMHVCLFGPSIISSVLLAIALIVYHCHLPQVGMICNQSLNVGSSNQSTYCYCIIFTTILRCSPCCRFIQVCKHKLLFNFSYPLSFKHIVDDGKVYYIYCCARNLMAFQ